MNPGDRMKNYEACWDQVLPARLPIIVRLDGNSFSMMTKRWNLKKPFDERLRNWMASSIEGLINYCSGLIIAYCQSDEISLLLRNDQKLTTEPFLANRVQKICSLLAAKASVDFNESLGTYNLHKAIFDCRVFILPEQEINSYFLWRQRDAFKNCVSSYCVHSDVAGSSKAVHGLSTEERQEWLFKNCGININEVPTWHRRGFCMYSQNRLVPIKSLMPEDTLNKLVKEHGQDPEALVERSEIVTDLEIPLFDEDPEFIVSGGRTAKTNGVIPT